MRKYTFWAWNPDIPKMARVRAIDFENDALWLMPSQGELRPLPDDFKFKLSEWKLMQEVK